MRQTTQVTHENLFTHEQVIDEIRFHLQDRIGKDWIDSGLGLWAITETEAEELFNAVPLEVGSQRDRIGHVLEASTLIANELRQDEQELKQQGAKDCKYQDPAKTYVRMQSDIFRRLKRKLNTLVRRSEEYLAQMRATQEPRYSELCRGMERDARRDQNAAVAA